MSPPVYDAFQEICRAEAIKGPVLEVFLEGLVEPQCRWVISPPRIIGWARKP